MVAASKENHLADDQSVLMWDYRNNENPSLQNLTIIANSSYANWNSVALGINGSLYVVYAGSENNEYCTYLKENDATEWVVRKDYNDNNWVVNSCNTYGDLCSFAKNKDNYVRYKNYYDETGSYAIDINNPLWLSCSTSSFSSYNGHIYSVINDSSNVYTYSNGSYERVNFYLTDICQAVVNDNYMIVVVCKSGLFYKKADGGWIEAKLGYDEVIGYLTSCCISNDSRYIGVCSSNGYLLLYNVENKSVINLNASPSSNSYTKIIGSYDLSIIYVISTSQQCIYKSSNHFS